MAKQKETEAESIKHRFIPILEGDWVVASYFDTISQTKSPYKSQDALPGIVEFDIWPKEQVSDSLIIGALNIHEGTSLTIYFHGGKSETSLPINLQDEEDTNGYYELGYKIEKNDTSLILYHYNSIDSIINTIKYLKVRNHKEEAFQYQLNKVLFSGTYVRIDSSGTVGQVELTNEGVIKGMPEWKNYFVIADFVAVGDSATDEICFEIQTKNQLCFAYKFSGDTLRLYEPIEDENGEFEKLGDLKYEFVKQNE